MDTKVDPYKVLGVSQNYTIEELKSAYKQMAMKVHPDKGGSEYLFKLVTYCYKLLSAEYRKKTADKQFYELKNEFKIDKPKSKTNVSISSSSSFDVDRFNKVFEDNKIDTVTDSGYGEFLKSTKDKADPKKLFTEKSFSNDAFNKQFERKTSVASDNKFIVKFKEPEPVLANKKMAFTELGTENIDDYSGENTSKKQLNFMDVRVALTTSRIIDPRAVEERKQYKTIKDLEADRGNISYTPSRDQIEYMEKKKQLEELKEQKRIETLLRSDKQYEEQFNRLHKLMLGR